ncbi:hypothetical protein NL676_001333 [Syzygium grande]|nr:hypothetical protein NL676_001333 [Syzygium grande]
MRHNRRDARRPEISSSSDSARRRREKAADNTNGGWRDLHGSKEEQPMAAAPARRFHPTARIDRCAGARELRVGIEGRSAEVSEGGGGLSPLDLDGHE